MGTADGREDGASPVTGIVTPEAVRLQFDTAGVGSRAVAFALDALVQGLALVALLVAGGLVAEGAGPGVPPWVGATLVALLSFAVVWGYPVSMETLWRGRTLGKAAMGLRVVTREGGPVRFRHAAVRAALGLVDFVASSGAVAVLCVLLTRHNQRLGDLVAGTLVLRERTGMGRPAPVGFEVPPGAETYAATLDVSAMTTEDYTAVRAFLLRSPGLSAQVRERLAAELASALAGRLRHARPQEVDPQVFLACLAARYQRRGAPARDATGAAGEAAVPEPPPGGFSPPG
ncbi:MAG: RDD family protein [Actinobacteria bacterium]|nr:RDD family protein [Actinomycetota bacterium]